MKKTVKEVSEQRVLVRVKHAYFPLFSGNSGT